MLMKPDNKKMATLIMAKMGKQPQEAPQSEDGAEMDDSAALKAAGEELMQALESKSPLAVMEALKAAIELCESPEEEAAEHEMPSEEEQE